MRYGYQTSRQTPIWVLIGVNFLVFILDYIVPGLYRNLALQLISLPDRPWAIVTSMFVHAGFSHIFVNMLTLFFFGTYLLDLVGRRKLLIVYFVGGILGNILFLISSYFGVTATPFSSVVGASGAIYALGGALALMRPNQRVFIFPIPVPIPLWIAVIGGFIIVSFLPRIAWQAHLGGLMVGLIAGYFFRRRERRHFWR